MAIATALDAGADAPDLLPDRADDHHHGRTAPLLGFWIYLMSDCLIFAVPVRHLRRARPQLCRRPVAARDLFDLPLVALNTAMLLLSSITYGFAMLEMQRKRDRRDAGLAGRHRPVRRRLRRHRALRVRAPDPRRRRRRSAARFLSAFFTLVGTHGLHVTFGIVWLVTLMVQVSKRGLIRENQRRLMCLSHVLALPRRRLDRRLHLRLSDGSAADERHVQPRRGRATSTAHGDDARPTAHVRGYLTGFVLSVILTASRSGW